MGLVLHFVSTPCPVDDFSGRNVRVVCLEGAASLGVVGDGLGGLEVASAGLDQRVLGRRGIEGVADPGVPAGLDVGGVVVVLGVLDPAGSQRQFLVVLEELVAGAVGTHETTVLGVTCGNG